MGRGVLLIVMALGVSLSACSASLSQNSSKPDNRSGQQRTTTTVGASAAKNLPSFGSKATSAYVGTPAGPGCQTEQLALAWGGYVSEATQQNSLGVDITNTSSAICHMSGYPGISLVAASGDDLPLTYRSGGDQMVTGQPPRNVNLPAGATVFVLMNQSRCENGSGQPAVTLRLMPPGNTHSLTIGFGQIHSSDLTYCGVSDPGSTLNISPIEPSAQAAFAH
jgi:Protein of unknown function (DUF4232)